MKKILAVLALAICVSCLPATADAKKQKTESGKAARVELNMAKGTVTINGIEHSMAEIKANMKAKNAKAKPNKNGKGVGVEFFPIDENCQFLLDEDMDAMWYADKCSLGFRMFEPIIDVELNFYTADEDKKIANSWYSDVDEYTADNKEHLIQLLNGWLEEYADEDGSLSVYINHTPWEMADFYVSDYAKESGKAVPSLYPLSDIPYVSYLLVPGDYVYKRRFEMESGIYSDESPFNMSYTPIPDPRGMFGVGIKDPAALKADKIKKIQTNIYRVVDEVNNKNINVIDISGKNVLKSNNEVNINNLSKGVYFLQVEDAVKKVVKE